MGSGRTVYFWSALVLPLWWALVCQAEERPYRMEEVTVQAEELETAGPFLPNVAGTGIYAGKKTAVIDLKAQPTIINNNFRQVLAKTPGLLLSEETTPLFSVGY
ncbi:MAG: hypothetical protein HYT88_07375 [Candidatus Omnitrophica bacterium]|nr:hypothetical protein [Candidatus Omnitrophota bacterium]